LQGYNAQAAATMEQVGPHADHDPHHLNDAGVSEPLQRLAADSGYWSIANVSAIPNAPELLIPPARHGRHGKPGRTASHRNPRAPSQGGDAGQAGRRAGQGLLELIRFGGHPR
jgi:hypothetical protein